MVKLLLPHIYRPQLLWLCFFALNIPGIQAADGDLPTPTEWIEQVLQSEHLINIDTPPAQERPRVYRFIKTNEYVDLLGSTDEQSRRQQQELKRWLAREAANAPVVQDVVIPIVFHIVHNAGKEKISEAQVLSQIEALNRDFGSTAQELLKGRIPDKAYRAEGFDKRTGQISIQFCVATRRVGNRTEKGIQYYEKGISSWSIHNDIKYDRDGAEGWDPDRYLNVWVGQLEERLSGYAQPPGWDKYTDGIVIDHRYFGTIGTAQAPYHLGRTMTHLVGNYLGIPSLWGMHPCDDDGIRDTPLHNEPNYGCPKYQHVSTCYSNPAEMTMNFMDNTDDECMYFFTEHQVHRMYAALTHGGPRHQIRDHGGTLCHEDLNVFEQRDMGIDEVVPYLQVYPNPARSYFTLESGQLDFGETITVVIKDLMGREVWRGTDIVGNSYMQIDCSAWSKGIYFVVIDNKVHQPYQKITIQ